MNRRATARGALCPILHEQRLGSPNTEGQYQTVNWQPMEFTDLACYMRLEEEEEKKTDCRYEHSLAETLCAIHTACPQIPGLFFLNTLNDKHNRWKYAVFSKLYLNSRDILTQ
jgi:hypothetical protein